jgi:hypothetical protein
LTPEFLDYSARVEEEIKELGLRSTLTREGSIKRMGTFQRNALAAEMAIMDQSD